MYADEPCGGRSGDRLHAIARARLLTRPVAFCMPSALATSSGRSRIGGVPASARGRRSASPFRCAPQLDRRSPAVARAGTSCRATICVGGPMQLVGCVVCATEAYVAIDDGEWTARRWGAAGCVVAASGTRTGRRGRVWSSGLPGRGVCVRCRGVVRSALGRRCGAVSRADPCAGRRRPGDHSGGSAAVAGAGGRSRWTEHAVAVGGARSRDGLSACSRPAGG